MRRTWVLIVGALAAGALGCGEEEPRADAEPAGLVARAAPPVAAAPTPAPATRAVVADDAEAAGSFPAADPSALTERAPAPGEVEPTAASSDQGTRSEDYVSPGAPSDAQIARELKQMEQVKKAYEESGGGSAPGAQAVLNADGTATPPKGAPEVVRRIIAAANAIAKFPYVYGGGHGSFVDTAYDCSGSVSYALAAAGLVDRPMVSGAYARTGDPGPGRWITIYANEGHMFMVVAGLRYDTSGRGGPLGSRWQTASRSTRGFEVRHPPGL